MNLDTALLFLSVRRRLVIVACEEACPTTALYYPNQNLISQPVIQTMGTHPRVGKELAVTTDRAEAPLAAMSTAHLGAKKRMHPQG